jgi:hypothetical protein
MIWIAALERPRTQPRGTTPPAVRRSNRAATIAGQMAPVVPPVQIQAPEPESHPEQATITAPLVDWNAALGKAVREFMRNEELAQQQPAENSKPQVLVLPAEPVHMKGQTEHFEGGVVRTWVDDRCYYELDPARGPDSRRVCKKRTMYERQSEERAAAIAQAVKGKRSGRKP